MMSREQAMERAVEIIKTSPPISARDFGYHASIRIADALQAAYAEGVEDAAKRANFYSYHWHVDGSDKMGEVIKRECLAQPEPTNGGQSR